MWYISKGIFLHNFMLNNVYILKENETNIENKFEILQIKKKINCIIKFF